MLALTTISMVLKKKKKSHCKLVNLRTVENNRSKGNAFYVDILDQ